MTRALEHYTVSLALLGMLAFLAGSIEAQQAGEGPAKTPKGGSWRPGSSPYAGTGEEKPATTTTGPTRQRPGGGGAPTQVSATPDATPPTREPTGKRPARGLAPTLAEQRAREGLNTPVRRAVPSGDKPLKSSNRHWATISTAAAWTQTRGDGSSEARHSRGPSATQAGWTPASRQPTPARNGAEPPTSSAPKYLWKGTPNDGVGEVGISPGDNGVALIAAPVPADVPRESEAGAAYRLERLRLAQMGWLECSPIAHPDCFNDLPAIYGTAQDRPRHWLVQLLDYTNLMSRKTERARRIRAMPWGDVPGWPAKWNRTWAAWRAHTEAVMAGKVINPCPRARHWGGPKVDDIPPSMVRVKCSRPTRNVFLRVR